MQGTRRGVLVSVGWPATCALTSTTSGCQPYIPAEFRAYPLSIISGENSQLCILEELDTLCDGYSGKAFFDKHQQLSPLLQDTLRFLIKLKDGQLKLSAALLSLEQAGVMEPWDELQELTGVQGLHRVCENKLKTLDDTGFVCLR